MYDINLRVTLKIWLLEVQIWKRNLKEALPLALDLACGVFDQLRNSTFAPETIHAIELQISQSQQHLVAHWWYCGFFEFIRREVMPIEAHLPGIISKKLESYVQQHMATAR